MDTPEIDTRAFMELGQTGLVRQSGFVFEEFLRELQGPKGMAVYREMRDNDAVIGAMRFAVDQLFRKTSWRVDAFDDSNYHIWRADYLQSCLDDMSATWTDTVSEITSFIDFGFSWHEEVYKLRLGNNPNAESMAALMGQDTDQRMMAGGEFPVQPGHLPASKHNDGFIGWKNLPIRAQESLWQWEFGEDGSIRAMIQRPAPHYRMIRLPIQKGLLFRHRAYKNSPEGRSALRSAYKSYWYKKNIERIEAIGIERDLAGLPVMEVPPEYLRADATAAQKTLLALFKTIVTNVRNDEQGGLVLPVAYDDKGHKLFDFKLLSTGGRRQVDTDKIISRYAEAIAQTFLADLILIGNAGKGSYALMEMKVELFTQSLEGWMDSVAEVFNRYAIPRLFRLNGWSTEQLPILSHGPVDAPDLKDLGDFITAAVAAGGLHLGPRDEGYLRSVARLPASEEDAANMEVGKSRSKWWKPFGGAGQGQDFSKAEMREMVEAIRDLRKSL